MPDDIKPYQGGIIQPYGKITGDEWDQPYDAQGSKIVAQDPTLEQSLSNIAWSPWEVLKGAVMGPIDAAKHLWVNKHFNEGPNPAEEWSNPANPRSANADAQSALNMTLFGGNALNPARMMEGAGAREMLPAEVAPARATIADRVSAFSERPDVSGDWYHAAHPDFQGFTDPTDYYGVHVTKHKPTAQDFQADRGGPLVRMDSPFSAPFTMPPVGSPNYAEALKSAQEFLPGFDGSKTSLENNVGTYRDALKQRGYDAIVSQDNHLLDDPFEAIALDPKNLNSAIYSDTGKPSLMGSALAGAEHDLPMDVASRLARAREQGFDVDTPLYHGTDRDFGAFEIGQPGRSHSHDAGIFTSPDPAEASEYAAEASSRSDWKDYNSNARDLWDREFQNPPPFTPSTGGAVYPLYGRTGNQATIDAASMVGDTFGMRDKIREALQGAKAQGYDSAIVKNNPDVPGSQNEHVFFNPANIRSKFAAFDPANADKSGLLFSDNRPNPVGAAIAGSERTPIKGYHGTGIDFDTFTPGKTTFVAHNMDHARDYAGTDGRVIPLEVSGNYFDPRDEAHAATFAEAAAQNAIKPSQYYDPSSPWSLNMELHREDPSITDWLRQQGYDGFLGHEKGYTHTAVFNPENNIKFLSDQHPSLLGAAMSPNENDDDWLGWLQSHR